MNRTILHLDLDAFFCAVEEQRDPSLRGVAFAVGGQPEQRGVVASCSYAARVYGVRSAMPMTQALRLCPDLRIVPHHFDLYHGASGKVMARLHEITPQVEQLSIDEAFLDVTGLRENGAHIARSLQAAINQDFDLPCSLGVASNKLVAKIANNIGKAEVRGGQPPNAIKIVPLGEEAAFLAPLPVNELWGIGPKTAQQLHWMGIRTLGELAAWPEQDLKRRFGKLGEDIARRARGLDTRPVVTEHEARLISKETTFAHDVQDAEVLRRTLRKLSDGVGWRLRRARLSGTTVRLKLRWSDFTTLTRQTTLPYAINQDEAIYAAALALFRQNWPGRAVRLIGVGISGFDQPARQLGLWDESEQPQDTRLQSVLDALRERFGEEVIQRGTDLHEGESR